MTQAPDTDVTPSGLPAWVRDILRCPACRSALEDVDIASGDAGAGGVALQCTSESCADLEPGQRRRYRIDDGIPVLLVDEAEVVAS